MILVVCYLLVILFILLSVAFFTLFEVSLLGGIHLRLGPDKVGFFGYLQPFGDFVKLFTKGVFFGSNINYLGFLLSPLLGLFLSLSMWLMYMNYYPFMSYYWGFMYFFVISSMSVYFLLFSGWSSGSLYSSFGSFRSASQSISYEVSMIFLILIVLFFFLTFNFGMILIFSSNYFFLFGVFPLFLCWLVSCLAESNRTPFDLSEGESELVSGFNTEYSGGLFALFFIAEYGFMLFLSLLTCLIFMNSSFMYLKVVFICLFYIWVRGSFPRMRFDHLMMFSWSSILPLSLSLYLFFCGQLYF